MRPVTRGSAGMSSGMSRFRATGSNGQKMDCRAISYADFTDCRAKSGARRLRYERTASCAAFSHVPVIHGAGRIERLGYLDKAPAFSVVRLFRFLLLYLIMLTTPAYAACTGVVAEGGTRLWHAAAGQKTATLTYLGHASFLIESPEGVRIVTDYNGVHRAKVTPDIVTMNNAHSTHYTDIIEPGVKFVLRGWDPGGGVANHDLQYRDVHVNNVPTNVRGFGETRYNGNSIF